MSLDELTDLCEALFSELKVDSSSFRKGTAKLSGLSDEQFLLAVRFVAGERVETPFSQPAPRRSRERVTLDPDEAAERLAKLEELDEETPSGPVDIGDGVSLL